MHWTKGKPTKEQIFNTSLGAWRAAYNHRDEFLSRWAETPCYYEYRRDPAYIARRDAVLARAGGVCEGCDSPAWLKVHHLHYWSLFREQPGDLAALCDRCHRRAHCLDESNHDVVRGRVSSAS